MRTTDILTVYSVAQLVRQSTDTDTSVATSVVMTPVVSSSNQLLTHYHTPDASLHDVSDVSITYFSNKPIHTMFFLK